MISETFEHLIKAFRDQKELVEKSIHQDRDFRQLCKDYEELGKSISYLKNLMNIPLVQFEKQISDQQELFNELEREIAFYLEKEK